MENSTLKNERLTNLNSHLSKMGIPADFTKKEIGKNYTVGDAMLSGERSPLTQIKLNTPDFSGNISGKLRVVYENQQDTKGKISVIGIQKELNVPKNIQDFQFTEEHTNSLKTTGHLGAVAKINGKDTYISVDKETNTLVTTSATKVNIPAKILGKDLSHSDQNTLKEGGTITVLDMVNKKGEKFSAEITVDAGKRGLEFKAIQAPKHDIYQNQKAEISKSQNLKETPKLQMQEEKSAKKTTQIKSLADISASKGHKVGLSL
ncbi:MAG: DUF3945 domain-containing protein [Bacteroidota bacterium]